MTTTHDTFGRLRSLCQEQASSHGFRQVMTLLLAEEQADARRCAQEHIPYALEHLATWPDAMREVYSEQARHIILENPTCAQLVRTLDLSGFDLKSQGLEQLHQAHHLSTLTSLNLSGCDLDAFDIVKLCSARPGGTRLALPDLQWLDVSHNSNLGDEALVAILNASFMPQLRALDYSSCGAHFLTSRFEAARLERLDLLDNAMDFEHFAELLTQSELPALSHLSLGHRLLAHQEHDTIQAFFALEDHILPQLTSLTCSHVPTRHLANASWVARIESLECISMPHLEEVLGAPMARLRHLRLHRCDLERGMFEHVASTLERLELSQCVHPGEAHIFSTLDGAHFTQLHTLHLHEGTLDEQEQAYGVDGSWQCPKLEHLSLAEIDLHTAACESLREAASLDRLKSFRLHHVRMTEQSTRALLSQQRLDRLEVLGMTRTEQAVFHETYPLWFDALSAASLTRLDVTTSWHTMSEDFVELVSAASWARTLTHLKLSQMSHGALDMEVLCQAPFLKQLEHLDLSSNYLGDEAIGVLCRGQRFERLRVLRLNNNQLTSKGMRRVLRDRSLWTLETLGIRDNADAGVIILMLFDSSMIAHLRHIDIMPHKLRAQSGRARVWRTLDRLSPHE